MTSEKILSAARELFEEKGFDLTSVREIATKADVNVALINYHFGSKDNLLLAIMEQSVDTTRLKLHDINQSSAAPLEKFMAVIDLYVDKIFSNCKYHQFIHRELSTTERPELTENIVKILNRNSMELRKLLEEGQRKKVFKKEVDIDLAMAALFGVIYQTTHSVFKKRYTRSGENEEVYKDRVKKFLFDLLGGYLIK
ncbi:TetR family transcriptional regulator [Ohtaekwangia kribbensis]|jgi:TetR/AcrR family fatty acid metabolism transcriptional regulator|uniref:TetR family transcriptional regulator n=1 Tax=Ohtaekwangia kribbensis TaxID=688913 RepID=A0ABW3K6C2_9BACT